MQFSDTFQSRPLDLTPTNNPYLFTEYRLVYQALYNFETATVITVVRVTKVIVENCT